MEVIFLGEIVTNSPERAGSHGDAEKVRLSGVE